MKIDYILWVVIIILLVIITIICRDKKDDERVHSNYINSSQPSSHRSCRDAHYNDDKPRYPKYSLDMTIEHHNYNIQLRNNCNKKLKNVNRVENLVDQENNKVDKFLLQESNEKWDSIMKNKRVFE